MARWIYSLAVKGDRETTGDHVSVEAKPDGVQVFIRQNGEPLAPFTIPPEEFRRMIELVGEK